MSLNQTLNQLTLFLFITLISGGAIAEQTYRVRTADNINSIVERFYPDRIKTKAQIMVGLLVENPRAFKGGNINFLMRGRRLRLLDENELSDISQENAQELLLQHTFYYREGVTGSEYLLPPVLGREVVSNKDDLGKENQNNKQQLLKINKLEEESSKLKKQLKQLFTEKKATDKKLLELENTIKASANKSVEPKVTINNSSHISVRNRELEETNMRLQQQLQQSRSALAENTRSSISLKRQVSTLTQKIQGEKSKALSTTSASKDQTKVEDKNNSGNLWSQYKWVLGLLFLFLALWFILTLKRKHKIEKDEDYASKIAEIESNSFIQQGKNDQIN